MTETTIAPYGSWESPITTDLILSGTVNLSEIVVRDGAVYWIESRPQERGRSVIVRWTPDSGARDVNPAPTNARSGVHEYGGGSYTVHGDVVYFTHYADQRIYRVRPDEQPEAITPAFEPERSVRFADLVVDAERNRLVAVCEDHRAAGEPRNSIVAIPLDGRGQPQTLVTGNDFYSNPRLSPDGRRLAWMSWNHPNMPWDGSTLWVASLDAAGAPDERELVAGGPAESIFQPEWSPTGVLHFVSDRTGWWNLYRRVGDDDIALYPMEAEFGQPQWVFGQSTYAFESAESIICSYTQNGRRVVARLDAAAGSLTPFDLPYSGTYLRAAASAEADLATDRARAAAYFIGGSPVEMVAVVRLDLGTGHAAVVRRSGSVTVDPGYLSVAQPVEFPTEGGLTAHGYFYPPANPACAAPAGERPPLIVTLHGGPTSATSAELNLTRQYWTSRGFAILDVNYGGSTGYGRAYRERLNGQWGVVDVDDCTNGARHLVERGLVDGERLIIRGGSAGGYTTLLAITRRDVFRAATSYYGISDAVAMALETHKFESRYTDNLIAPYPEGIAIYHERSAYRYVDQCSAALLLFQGMDDKIVLPNQSEAMYEAVRGRGLPVAYLAFEGEGHGFRQSATIKRTMEAELYFYGRVFGFSPADEIEPVEIENLG